MVQKLDGLIEEPTRESIILGKEFTIDGKYIDGAKEDVTITIKPEVVSVKDSEGKDLTIKVVFTLSEPITNTATGETITEITLGSFGQSDPVRMWMTAEFAADMIAIPSLITSKAGTEAVPDKLKLDELLYICLNAAFFANSKSHYSPENIHGKVKPIQIPPQIFTEIARRIKNKAPLNYQYLAYLQRSGTNLITEKNANIGILLLALADEEMETSTNHKIFVSKPENMSFDGTYDLLATHLGFLDFDIEFEGVKVLDNDVMLKIYEYLVFEPNITQHIISDVVGVNFTNILVNAIINHLDFNFTYDNPPYPESRSDIIHDKIREEVITRLYNSFVDLEKAYADNDFPINITNQLTLGQFAAAVTNLRLNNQDPNMREYLYSRDDSRLRIAAAKGEN